MMTAAVNVASNSVAVSSRLCPFPKKKKKKKIFVVYFRFFSLRVLYYYISSAVVTPAVQNTYKPITDTGSPFRVTSNA